MDLRTVLWNVLGFGVFPLWLAAGGADWLCHRRTAIDRTSGSRESALHILLYLQIAIPVLLGTFLEINALLLLVFALAVLAHMATSLWDTAYSQPRRFISPLEQQVHSWLEMLPLMALVLITVLHLPQWIDRQWTPAPRALALPSTWRFAIPIALAFGLLPILEEWLRGRRAR
jgi:hypothetical protein